MIASLVGTTVILAIVLMLALVLLLVMSCEIAIAGANADLIEISSNKFRKGIVIFLDKIV